MENKIATADKITNEKLIQYLDVMGLAENLNEKEKELYIEICQGSNLNPFKREIHVTKYGKNGKLSIVTGYEVYIKRANATGLLDGWNCATEGRVEDGTLKAILTIHRKDWKHPFVHEVEYCEFAKEVEITTMDAKGIEIKTGKFRPTEFWKKAKMMIKKVAESQGFRLCFPELQGLPYTREEMPEEQFVTHEVVTTQNVTTVTNATPQPTIDNYVHAVNALKKEQTIEELKANWERINFETQSHPSVRDEFIFNLKNRINECKNVDELKKLWASITSIGKDKEIARIEFLTKAKDEKKSELTKK